jgi:hypothetical protein
MPKPRLLFVYNADGGLLNALKDMVHKLASRETYPCSLCATTYGAVAMRPEWKAYLNGLLHEPVFLHRDKWRKAHPAITEPLPAIFIQRGRQQPQTLVTAAEMPLGQSLDQLMALVDERLVPHAS